MVVLKDVIRFMFTPKLYRVYGNPGEIYKPSSTEKFGDHVVQLLQSIWHFGLYTSPVTLAYMYRRGYFISDNIASMTKFLTSIGVILVVTFWMRGYGRAKNPTYKKFAKSLEETKKLKITGITQLSNYDFDFYAWPIDFKWSQIEKLQTREFIYIRHSNSRKTALQWIMTLPCQIIAYLAIHTFGIHLIYPGSLTLFQIVIATHLEDGRSKLIEEHRGTRYKLETKDKNYIDSMFVDKRKSSENGSTLVVCCEGNAGFYEIGIMGTPIEMGYSVLGWNHPGFASSTGTPYPKQEHNAINVVMQFAIHKLGFKVEDIILYGWSIGGYPCSWAAMNYDVKGVILDATFDDVLPIALQQMPAWWESIVRVAIRHYVNLNNYEQLCRYNGPILLIRRTDDEVIFTVENNVPVNRGNYLLLRLMKYRYPLIFADDQVKLVNEYLALNISQQENFLKHHNVDSDLCTSMMESYVLEHSKTYPMRLGEASTVDTKNQLALFLVIVLLGLFEGFIRLFQAHKHLKDYKSTHCTPLPREMFQIPWDVNIENDYVFT